MQFFNFFAGPFGLLRVVTNLDEVSIQGFELDFRWLATDNLSLFGGYGYTDGEIDRYDGRPYTAGNKIPYVPEYTGNLGASCAYRSAAATSSSSRAWTAASSATPGSIRCRTSWCRICSPASASGRASSRSRCATPTRRSMRASGSKASAGRVTAWGRNVTDEEYLQEVIPAPEFGGSFIHDSAGDAYGVDVRYSFR